MSGAVDPLPWVVGVGASGVEGIRDLEDFLAAWPPRTDASLLVVLHRPAEASSILPHLLQRRASVPVIVPHQDDPVRAGVCYVGLPAAHLTIDDSGRIRLLADGAFRNRTIDLLFKSVAGFAGPHAVGIVLSGSLDDGARGAHAIRHAGGLVGIVTPTSSVTRQMPQSVLEMDGPVAFHGKPADPAAEIARNIATRREQIAAP